MVSPRRIKAVTQRVRYWEIKLEYECDQFGLFRRNPTYERYDVSRVSRLLTIQGSMLRNKLFGAVSWKRIFSEGISDNILGGTTTREARTVSDFVQSSCDVECELIGPVCDN